MLEKPYNGYHLNYPSSGVLNSGGATNNYTSGIITTMLDMGLVQELLLTNRTIYRVSLQFVVYSFNSCIHNFVTLLHPPGPHAFGNPTVAHSPAHRLPIR